MWLLPSKGRVENVQRFFEAYHRTGGSTPGIVIVERAEAPAYTTLNIPLGWSWRVTDGVTQGEKLAEIWDEVKDCAWLGLIGDDCVPETPLWDRQMVEALDGANIVSCDDGWQAPKRLGNCWLMSGPLLAQVGYIFPPGLHHLYVDDIWETLGRETSCWRVLMDVRVNHRHVLKGEAKPDATHRAVYGADGSNPQAGLWPTDTRVYQEWLHNDRHRASAAIIAFRRECASARPEEAAQIEARTARAKSRSVFIATPAHDGCKWQFAQSLAETSVLLEREGIRARRAFVGGSSNLPRARNWLVAWFLASGFTDLLFIDSDMGWEPGAVIRLLASDKDVIGAVGRKKDDNLTWCLKVIPGTATALRQDEMGAIEVLKIGTGMLKITREALEAIIAARPDLKREGDNDMPGEVRGNHHQFFRFGDHDEGEDYEFCALYRSVGGSIWVDPEIGLVHVGEKEYFGRFGDALMAVRDQAA